MKNKKIWPLLGLVFVLVVFLGVYVDLKGKDSLEEKVDNEMEDENPNYVLDWREEKTHKISVYDNDGEKIAFTKENELWKIDNYEKISLIKDEITSMIEYASEITAERVIENVEDLSEYGLDKPLNVIERETVDGTTESFTIGLHSTATECTYIYLNDKTDVVYAVSTNLGNLYKYDMLDFVEREAYPTFFDENVKKVEIVKEEGSFALVYDFETTTSWSVEDDIYGKKLADDTAGDNLASMVSVIAFSTFYEYDCQDFSKYGLDEPQMEIRVTYHETVEVEAEESEGENTENEDVEESIETQTVERVLVISVGGYDEEGYYYVRMNDSKEVHGIAETHINKLLGETSLNYWALNMSEVSWNDMDYMKVQYGGETYVLDKVETESEVEDSDDESEEAKTTKVTICYVNDVEVDADVFEDFYRAAIGIACQERKIELDVQNDAEWIFDFYGVDGEHVIVSYIPWDENFYAVINNGTDYGLVNKMKIKDLQELFQKVIE